MPEAVAMWTGNSSRGWSRNYIFMQCSFSTLLHVSSDSPFHSIALQGLLLFCAVQFCTLIYQESYKNVCHYIICILFHITFVWYQYICIFSCQVPVPYICEIQTSSLHSQTTYHNAGPSPTPMLTEKSNMFSSKFLWLSMITCHLMVMLITY